MDEQNMTSYQSMPCANSENFINELNPNCIETKTLNSMENENIASPQRIMNSEKDCKSDNKNRLNVDLDKEEVWVETVAAMDGKCYYYNAKTRETTWTKPQEREGIKVLTQHEVEELAAKLRTKEGDNKPNDEKCNDKPVMIENEPKGISDGTAPFNPFPLNGPRPVRIPVYLPSMQRPDGPHRFMPPRGYPPPWRMPPRGLPPRMAPPPGFGPPGFVPPPGFATPRGFATPPGFIPPPWIRALPPRMGGMMPIRFPIESCDWSEHTAPDGKKYYYNSKTQESVWHKPKDFADYEKRQSMNIVPDPSVAAAIAAAQAAAAAAKAVFDSNDTVTKQTNETESAPECNIQKIPKKIEENKTKPQDKSKPVSSTPVIGTPWCVVWTGDNRSFFYNPSTKKSVWERPLELVGRPDVKEMLKSQSAAEKLKNKNGFILPQTAIKTDPDSIAEMKRNGIEPQLVFEDEMKKKTNEETPLLQSNTIDKGKEAAIEAEVKAARERQVLPLEQRMKQFRDLLTEKDISAYSTWEKELHKIVFDPRYLLITSKERKAVFERYTRDKAEEKRREKRNRAREKEDTARKEKEREERELIQRREKEKEVMKKEIERDENRRKRKREERDREEREREVREREARESEIKERERQREEKEKEERIAASLKKREEEVANELSGHLRARDKERELYRHHEAVSHFEALLVDLIRQPDYTWKEAKRILKKDARYESISANLEKSEREMRFDDHIDRLVAKKKENYRKMLEECKGIELDSSWKEIKKIIKDDPRYMKFSSSDRKCEKAFNEYLKDKMSRAKSAFKELLQETKKITDKSLSMVKEKDSGHMSEIIELLSKDKRYLDLESVEDERSNILTSYLEEIERRGPPPPPTASEPQRRSAKI